MLINARPVFVIQHKSTGLFLHTDLMWVKSLRLAGRADTYESAIDTAQYNACGDVDIHTFYEVNR